MRKADTARQVQLHRPMAVRLRAAILAVNLLALCLLMPGCAIVRMVPLPQESPAALATAAQPDPADTDILASAGPSRPSAIATPALHQDLTPASEPAIAGAEPEDGSIGTLPLEDLDPVIAAGQPSAAPVPESVASPGSLTADPASQPASPADPASQPASPADPASQPASQAIPASQPASPAVPSALPTDPAGAAAAPVKPRTLDPKGKMLALTFDDGPLAGTTGKILDALRQNGASATFFAVGSRIAACPDIIRRIAAEGSEIGNHTWRHVSLSQLSASAIHAQIDPVQHRIAELTGSPPRLLRPTYGALSATLRQAAGLPLILWSVDPRDWDSRSAERIASQVLASVRDGDIVLLHDIYPETAAAMQKVIPELVRRGYQLVTVSELFRSRGVTLRPGLVYSRMRP